MTISTTLTRMFPISMLAAATLVVFKPSRAYAHGNVGDHINKMQEHLVEYESGLRKTIQKYQDLVDVYSAKGTKAVDTGDLIKYWEEEKMHYPIELNYVPIYAKIWQSIYAIKEGVDQSKPKAEVQGYMVELREHLLQGLGAVKLAAQLQANKKASGVAAPATEKHAADSDPVVTLTHILDKLDRIMAKSAERDFEASKKMVHDTYLNLFEGVEGAIIEKDAKLVADLEKDFNVVLPKLIESESALAEIKKATENTKLKIAKARDLLKEGVKEKKDAF